MYDTFCKTIALKKTIGIFQITCTFLTDCRLKLIMIINLFVQCTFFTKKTANPKNSYNNKNCLHKEEFEYIAILPSPKIDQCLSYIIHTLLYYMFIQVVCCLQQIILS